MTRNHAIIALAAGSGLAVVAGVFLSRIERRPDPVGNEEARAIVLSVDTPFSELAIPRTSRPDGLAPSETVGLPGPWRIVMSTHGTSSYETPLPIRPRGLFFTRAPDGMVVAFRDGDVVPHEHDAKPDELYWSYDANSLQVTVPNDQEQPELATLTLSYPLATLREASLNWEFSGVETAEDFVRTTIQDGPTSRTGVLLPAPSTASWDVEFPPAAELHFAVGLVRPELREGQMSDGAIAVAEVTVDGQTTEVWRTSLAYDEFEPERIDLSEWAGLSGRLTLRTEPRKTAQYDYVFFGDVALASREANPTRVVMIFVDTLRVDHLGTYGYQRDTSPSLDRFAESAVVFDSARSVAPWTLPTARTLVTGRHPELYRSATPLPQILGEQGFTTAMFAGNLYLSTNFGINRGWGMHQVVNWPLAEDQVDDALDWLEQTEGRDSLLMLHFMDAHLPYTEPRAYRKKFAGPTPDGMDERFHRSQVMRERLRMGDAGQQWVIDRYDNNILYIHDQLERLFAELNDDDIVVYFSDHGEEFWDHGGFEHGHSLYDELLHVPFVVRAPGLAPDRVVEPVSLLDLTPTLLELLDLPAREVDGISLVPAMRDDEGARTALLSRDQAIGRPLYGSERWGVLHGQEKYTSHEGRESLYDLSDDPDELDDTLRGAEESAAMPFRGYLGDALGTEVVVAYRFEPGTAYKNPKHDLLVNVHIPGGVAAAWVGDDPTSKSSAEVSIDGETAILKWHAGYRGAREVFVVPTADYGDVTHDVTVAVRYGDQQTTMDVPETRAPHPDAMRRSLARVSIGERTLEFTWGIVPLPRAEADALDGYDAELADMLKAMGYTVGDDGPTADKRESGDDETDSREE